MITDNYRFEFAPYNGPIIVRCSIGFGWLASACKQRGEHGRNA